MLGAVETVRAQDQKPKGFEYAKDKKKEAGRTIAPIRFHVLESITAPCPLTDHLVIDKGRCLSLLFNISKINVL
jgi:hypothetical protein